jgi:hypothetical protein
MLEEFVHVPLTGPDAAGTRLFPVSRFAVTGIIARLSRDRLDPLLSRRKWGETSALSVVL